MSPTPLVLLEAIDEYSLGNYAEAIVLLQAVIADATVEQSAKEWAISLLLACAQHLNASDLSSYLELLESTNPELSRTIDFVLPHAYLDEGLIRETMAAFDANIAQYPNSELERDALYGRFLDALYVGDDTTGARSYLTRLESNYPESDEAYVANIQFENFNVIGLEKSGAPSAGSRIASEVPAAFRLAQNYPNPFNPTTVIRYDLPVDGVVGMKVYDILGKEVVTLVDGFQKAGYHHVSFDASRLATGVYFYRLTAGTFTDVKKLLVVK